MKRLMGFFVLAVGLLLVSGFTRDLFLGKKYAIEFFEAMGTGIVLYFAYLLIRSGFRLWWKG
jgi:hypothetical protein